jgi:hypothetical protein
MCQLSNKIYYTIEWQNPGHYGVRAAVGTGPQVLIAPFVTRGEAQAWIDALDEQDACDGLNGRSCLRQQD